MPKTDPLIKANKIAKVHTFFSCISGYDGTPLDCDFKYIVNGLKSPVSDVNNSGGHNHDYATRNYTFYGKDVQYDVDKNAQPLTVEGTTLSTPPNNSAMVIHEIPVISGNIEVDSFLIAPRGWICGGSCYTKNTWRNLWTYKVGINNLEKLPVETPSDSYIRVRRDPTNGGHPFEEGYYGAKQTNQLLPLIAENHFIIRGKKLSVNDISLIKGGYFDIFGKWESKNGNPIKNNTIEWQGGHNTHREGKDVDINAVYDTNGVKIDCNLDTSFHLAVDMVLPPLRIANYQAWQGKPTAVLCESAGRKHIDFEPAP